MEIVDYELFAVPPRWLLLKLETDEGTTGWGEPIVQGRLETVRTAVSELVEGHLLTSDPLRTEYHWRKLYQSAYFRGGSRADERAGRRRPGAVGHQGPPLRRAGPPTPRRTRPRPHARPRVAGR